MVYGRQQVWTTWTRIFQSVSWFPAGACDGWKREMVSGNRLQTHFLLDVFYTPLSHRSQVCGGWSHTVAKGVDRQGKLVFIGWGRRDLDQLGHQPLTEKSDSDQPFDSDAEPKWMPRALPRLPEGEIREVWCGAESTVCCSEDGRLWATGWNEHGNLGVSLENPTNNIVSSQLYSDGGGWRAVLNADGTQVRLAEVWEGAASCGGGHTVAIVSSNP